LEQPDSGAKWRRADQFVMEGGMDDEAVNFVKVFSTTKPKDRDGLGERVTAWLRDHPGVTILHTDIRLTSDRRYHCFSMLLFGHEDRREDRHEEAPAP